VDLVFLHGPAASGKLTVARALEDRVGFPVLHNHLVVDLLTTVFPFGSEPFVRLREEFWTSVFAEAARADRSISFTFAPEATVRPGFPGRVRQLVEGEGGRICRLPSSATPATTPDLSGYDSRGMGMPRAASSASASSRRDGIKASVQARS
jgi:hypothetical protein